MGPAGPYLSLNSNCARRYRSFFQTGQVCPPESTCQRCGTPICVRPSWNGLLMLIRPSLSPQETQSSRSFSFAADGLRDQRSGPAWCWGPRRSRRPRRRCPGSAGRSSGTGRRPSTVPPAPGARGRSARSSATRCTGSRP